MGTGTTEVGGVIVFVTSVVLACVLYMIPTLVASRRQHHQRGAITALNIMLGWTMVGWVAALTWSLTEVLPPAHTRVTVREER